MSKNKHPDLGEIQRSLNQALEGYRRRSCSI